MVNTALRKKFLEIHRILGRRYPKVRRHRPRPLMDELMLQLAGNRSDEFRRAALDRIRKRFADWNELRVARVSDAERIFEDLPGGSEWAVRAIRTLEDIFQDRGDMDLAFLGTMKLPEVRRFLTSIKGIDRAEADAVILEALNAPVMPVTEWGLRFAKRMSLAGKKATRAHWQKVVEETLPVEHIYKFYKLIEKHVETICHPERPECDRCLLRGRCSSKGRF